MPTEVAPAGRGHDFQEFHCSGAARALPRLPDCTRRSPAEGGRVSAVERLAADRLKYVKSPQAAGASTLSSASGSSSEGCSLQSGGRKSARGGPREEPGGATPQPATAADIPRRSSSKRQSRPDSLLIYRQKPKGAEPERGGGDPARGGFVRRLFQSGSGKEKGGSPSTPKAGALKEGGEEAPKAASPESRLEAPQGPPEGRWGGGVHRSQSDISSRYSKTFSEFDTFFRFCGLEPEVIEAMGRERFSPGPPAAGRLRSASMATSDSGFSRHSGDEGLQEDELQPEQPHSGTSVIERNARIIKWLYSCRAAREGRGLRELA